MTRPVKGLGEMVDRLCTVSNRIFHLEMKMRDGGEAEMGLEEVGRRALLIRDLNAERVEMINGLNALDPEARPDIKVMHRSERK